MKYGIALGSNKGDRLAHLQEARALLLESADAAGAVLCSSVYETDPVDCEPGAASFYNACLEIELPHSPAEILAFTQGIERTLGRAATAARNAPRPIDIDILYLANGESHSAPELEIPHPRLTGRRFVLEPLNEIRPDLVLPGAPSPVSEILNQLESAEPPLILVVRDW